MIIAIDFDGTIVKDAYPGIGSIMPDCVSVINDLAAKEHYIIINTCRTGVLLDEAIRFIKDNNIPYNAINDNKPELTEEYGYTRKVFADVYIDDRNLGGFFGWKYVSDFLIGNNPEFEEKLNTLLEHNFKLTIADLRIRTRKREIVEARQVCMWWLKNNTKQSLNEIGSFFGNFDHATVLHACKTVNNLIDTNKAFKQKIEPFIQQS